MHLCLLGPDWRTTRILRKDFVQDARAAGWAVTIVCGKDGDRYVPEFEAMGVRCITVPLDRGGLNPFHTLTLLLRLIRVLSLVKPNAVLAFTVVPIAIGLIAARLAGVRDRIALVTGVGYAFSGERGLKRNLLRLVLTTLMRISLGGLRLAIFQNPDDMALFRSLRLIGGQTPAVKVNGSGVDLSHFGVAPLPAQRAFVMVCRLIREKGVFEFARAAELVLRHRPEVEFFLIAPVDVNPEALTPADLAPWTSTGAIQHVGFCEDVRPWLRGASVFVLPSFYREGTPRAALEALSMGRPVITTDAPGCREAVIDGETGLLIPVRDADALAAAMLTLIEDPVRLARMSLAARADAEDRFDVHKVNRAMMDAIVEARATA